MEQTPDFAKPPIVEFVLGAQFAPLENFTTGHFGLFWEQLGREEWPIAGEEPPLDPQFELFDAPRWQNILPGLFGTLSTTTQTELSLEHRAAEWSYEIKPKKGRLHVNAQVGFLTESQKPSLLLNITARGPVDGNGTESLREGLDLGHSVSVREFLAMVNPEIRKTWSP